MPTVSQDLYEQNKSRFELIKNEKTNGHILRSKTENYQYGEKSSKFFLNLEKKAAIQNTIKSLASDPNNLESVTYSQTEIIQ